MKKLISAVSFALFSLTSYAQPAPVAAPGLAAAAAATGLTTTAVALGAFVVVGAIAVAASPDSTTGTTGTR